MTKSIFSAIGFLTIIPVRQKEITPSIVALFPVAGLLLGGILLLLNIVFSQFR
ncbi:MAG: adenosylcobinamide-GDP ribazoletransferase [Elusimicrobiota bacterium]